MRIKVWDGLRLGAVITTDTQDLFGIRQKRDLQRTIQLIRLL
jgi:hypothetical protein